MSTGRKIVRGIEKGLTIGLKATKGFWREVVEAVDEAPRAFERIGNAVEDVVEHADQGTSEDASRPSLSDPCPVEGRNGQHSLYANAGPGGKRDKKEGWQCCESCGANGPMDEPMVDAK
jgi:hypothetical protein